MAVLQIKADPEAAGGSKNSSRGTTPQPGRAPGSKAANKRKANTPPVASIVKKVPFGLCSIMLLDWRLFIIVGSWLKECTVKQEQGCLMLYDYLCRESSS